MWPALLTGLRGLLGRAAVSGAGRAAAGEAAAGGRAAAAGASQRAAASSSTGEKGFGKRLMDLVTSRRSAAATAEKTPGAASKASTFVAPQGKEASGLGGMSPKPTLYEKVKIGVREVSKESMYRWNERFQNSGPGQFYKAAQEFAQWSPPKETEGPPKNQPNEDPTGMFPNLTLDQMSSLSKQGASYDDFLDADKAAERHLKEKEAQEDLIQSTKKLGTAFSKMLVSSLGFLAAPGAAMAVTAANGMWLNSQMSRFGMYNADFAGMKYEREMNQLGIDRRTAAATSGSANVLNQSQMRGDRLYAEIDKDLKTLINIAGTVAQEAANYVFRGVDNALNATGIAWLLKKYEEYVNAGLNKNDTAATAMMESILAQMGSKQDKRRKPLPGVK